MLRQETSSCISPRRTRNARISGALGYTNVSRGRAVDSRPAAHRPACKISLATKDQVKHDIYTKHPCCPHKTTACHQDIQLAKVKRMACHMTRENIESFPLSISPAGPPPHPLEPDRRATYGHRRLDRGHGNSERTHMLLEPSGRPLDLTFLASIDLAIDGGDPRTRSPHPRRPPPKLRKIITRISIVLHRKTRIAAARY
jgi:hypothetical protein